MTREDTEREDMLDGEAVTPEERAAARRLARLIDGLVAGAATTTDDPAERELVEHAAILRTAARRERIVEEVLARGLRKKTRWRRPAPWLGAAALVSAAAAVILLLRPPSTLPGRPAQATREPAPELLRSRPADALIGRIDPAKAGDARERLDRIYADRLAGYRQVALRRGGAR